MTAGDDSPSIGRRGLLAVLAAGASTGCLQRARSLVNRRSPEQVAVTIKTVPADDDEACVEIARHLQEHMQAVGIDATIEPQAESAFLRDVLLNNDFDVYVGRFPPRSDPDFLRATLHSEFVPEPGWQNPFGLSDLDLDELLTAQRRAAGSARRTTVDRLATSVARTRPFSVVCFPREATLVRTDRFEGWPAGGHLSSLDYLAPERRADGTTSPPRLTVAYTDTRITRNLNPIAVEYRRRGTITGLLYDSLARRVDGTIRPWLATDVTWDTEEGTTATVSLREARWHDGDAVTAADVAFTYRFFDDTTLGEGDVIVPAPRFRGRTSLVESITARDEHTVRLSFGETSRAVAERALTVPILPAHVWESRTGSVDLAGVDVARAITEALVWPNAEPVGGGPLTFASRTPDERLVLARFDDHFLTRNPPAWFEHTPSFDELVVRVAPSEEAAMELVAEGTADAIGTPVRPATIGDGPAEESVTVRVDTPRSFYHVGFNTRREPFGNVRFRRLLSRLLDPASIVESVFDGAARPAATPLAGTAWAPGTLDWNGSDPVVPFLGSDGELNRSAARDAFREAGFRYDDGRLVR